MTTSNTPGSTTSPRRKPLLATVITVAVLAVVLFVVGSLTPIKLPERTHSKVNPALSTAFVQRAEEALQSGDTTRAAQLASQAVQTAPSSAAAKQIQEKVQAAIKDAEKNGGTSTNGKTSGNTAGSGGKTGSGTGTLVNTNYFATDPGPFAKRGIDMEQLVPKKVLGYDFTGAWKADGEIQKTALSVDPRGPVESLIFTVREMKSSDKAKSFIEKTSKQLYKHDAKPALVDGVNSYFGTDGDRYATVVYVRGVYVFELLATSRNVKPVEIRSDVVNAAKEFTDTVTQ